MFAASIVVIALIAGYLYDYLKAIELKQHVEVANDLQEMILEIRRYEKITCVTDPRRICSSMCTRLIWLSRPWADSTRGQQPQDRQGFKEPEKELLAYKQLMLNIPVGQPRRRLVLSRKMRCGRGANGW